MLNKNRLITTAAAVLLSGFVFSGSAIAHPASDDGEAKMKHSKKMHRQHGSDMGGMRGLRRAFAQLDLTEQQQELLKSLKETNKGSMQAAKSSMKPLKKQMHELLMADDIDEAAVKGLSIQMAERKADHMIMMASIKKQAIAILTDEQRAKLKKMKEKRQEKMKRHHSKS